MNIDQTRSPGKLRPYALETKAREARYTALVKRGRQLGIRSILVGHHGDDTYEGLLLSLAMYKTLTVPMSSRNCLPFSRHLSLLPRDIQNAHWSRPSSEDGGKSDLLGVQGVPNLHMEVVRPLLGFEKARLVDTCLSLGIDWVEDESNADATFTSRNAIRHLVSQQQIALPSALSKKSLLSSSRARLARQRVILDVVEKLVQLTSIKLDLRTASALIRMPSVQDIEEHFATLNTLSSSLSEDSLDAVMASYLERLCHLIDTPKSSKPQEISTIFGPVSTRTRFTYNEVSFDPRADGSWLLSPKPPHQGVLGKRSDAMVHRFSHQQQGAWSAWCDLDRKWAVRVRNPSPTQTVVLGYLKPEQLKRLRAKLDGGDISLISIADPFKSPRNLRSILGALNAHYLRFWLPVLSIRSQAEEKIHESLSGQDSLRRAIFGGEGVEEDILAFPTLGLRVAGKPGSVPWWIEALEWECWYKDLDGMEGRLDESIVVPSSLEERGLVTARKTKSTERPTSAKKKKKLVRGEDEDED